MKSDCGDGSRIRIAYLIDTIASDTAGTQKQLLETICRLNKERFEPFIICLWESAWMVRNKLPCPCIVLGYHGFIKLDFPVVIRRLVRVFEDRKFHIVQTFFEDSIFVGLLGKVLSKNSLILLSSRRDIGLSEGEQPWYHSLFTLLLPWVDKYFSGIIANSEQVAVYATKRGKTASNKIKIIRNGVKIPVFPNITPASFDIGIRETVWIGMVASLTPVKRHDVLIKAVDEMRSNGDYQVFKVLLLGEGPENDNIKKLVKDYELQDYVYFTGAVKDVSSYLYHIDIGVLCSDKEGLSNAILEYMACGLPVIATSVGGNTELVDETNGFCFPPGDYHALAICLQRLIEDEQLRQTLGRASLAKIEKSYSWEKTMTELESYYISLVENKR